VKYREKKSKNIYPPSNIENSEQADRVTKDSTGKRTQMTTYPDFMGNRIAGSVIPAACLALLTIGRVSFWGNASFSLLPLIFMILSITVSLIVIIMHTSI
jgi:hypothetical protein